jgi:hypothetical protein
MVAFRGFQEAKHSDRALNDLEARIKNSFKRVETSRILNGRLIENFRLRSVANQALGACAGVGRLLLTVSDYTDLGGVTIEIRTNNTFRTGKEGSGADWLKGASNNAAASNIASYYSTADANLVCTATINYVEVLTGAASVLQAVQIDNVDGLTLTQVDPAIRLGASTIDMQNGDYLRFGPATLSQTDRMLPGVSRVVSLNDEVSGAGKYAVLDALPSSMRGGLSFYGLMRNGVPGTTTKSKYFIVNKNKPANIFRTRGMGQLTLLCDDDCTVDMWVF